MLEKHQERVVDAGTVGIRGGSKMRIQLSDHFNYKRLIRFVLPSILMIICSSIYSIVDGFFVSNFVGKTAFAAINLIMPVLMLVGTIGTMIGTGGSAIISKTMGEGKKELANQYFSMLIIAAFLMGIIASVIGFTFAGSIASLLGAKGELHRNAVLYARILFVSMPAYILQFAFQSFWVAAEKPSLNLKINILAGLTNAFFDWLFIAVFQWGIAGAAAATAIGQCIGGIVPVIYFMKKNSSLLQLTLQTKFYKEAFQTTCSNGSSEMVTNISTSAIGILYNFQLMKFAGENGLAAYGVIMYVNYIFMAVFLGYSIGSAPIVSYHYGAGHTNELRNLYRKSLILMGGSGIFMVIFAELLSEPLSTIFVNYDKGLLELTIHGFRLYCLAFLIMGVNVWASAFFTALNNGVVSATISFLRTFAFQIIAVISLPVFWGVDGIWLSIVVAELLAFIVTIVFFVSKKSQYQYM